MHDPQGIQYLILNFSFRGELGNIFSNLPDASAEEVFEVLHKQKGLTIERIISNGQATPEGEWFDQKSDEWVLLIDGNGVIRFEDGTEITLSKGDYLFIAKHKKHRVIHTDPNTIWLAVHMGPYG